MGTPGERNVKRTHSLFVDDLKAYQESHKALKDANEITVQVGMIQGRAMVWQNVQRSFSSVER